MFPLKLNILKIGFSRVAFDSKLLKLLDFVSKLLKFLNTKADSPFQNYATSVKMMANLLLFELLL